LFQSGITKTDLSAMVIDLSQLSGLSAHPNRVARQRRLVRARLHPICSRPLRHALAAPAYGVG
jgi:hypothetical protein